MRFGDLPAQDEADAGAAWLRREEGHEQVRRVRQAGPFVIDPQANRPGLVPPADADTAACLECGVHRIAYEIDQQLFELIGIGADRQVGTRVDTDPQTGFHADHALDELRHMDVIESRRRELRELGVGRREAAERIGTGGDDREAATHIVVPVVGQVVAPEHRFQAAGDRLDRRERVVDLVTDDADQPLPGLTLFVAERTADVGQHQELMGQTALTERRAPHFEPSRAAGERDVGDSR